MMIESTKEDLLAQIEYLQSRIEALEKTKESLCKALDDAGDSLIEVADKIEALEKELAGYKMTELTRLDQELGFYSDNAMQSEKGGV